MCTATAKKSKLPKFRSDQEERDFWARHRVEEFAEELQDLDVVIRSSRTEQIAVRLYKEDLQALRSLAAQRGIGHHPGEECPRGLARAVAREEQDGASSAASPIGVTL